MKTLYLHIGAGKTGTTAIQEFCLLNKKALRKRGYLFPRLGMYGESHNLLGHAWGVGWMPEHMIEKLVPHDIWQKAYELFQKSGLHMIISSETLTSAFVQKPESMQEIRNLFKDYPVKIIFYIRRQDLHAQSVYNQRVKTGHTGEKFDSRRLPGFYNLYSFLQSVAGVFGKENIIVRPYEKAQFRDGNIFSDFLSTVDVEWSSDFIIPEKDPNPRLGRETMEFLRIANTMDRPWERKLQFNQFVGRLNPFRDSEDSSQNMFISQNDTEAILERFEDGNRRVAREFLGRADGVLFYDMVAGSQPSGQDDSFSGLRPKRAVYAAIQIWERMHDEYAHPTVKQASIQLIKALAASIGIMKYLRPR